MAARCVLDLERGERCRWFRGGKMARGGHRWRTAATEPRAGTEGAARGWFTTMAVAGGFMAAMGSGTQRRPGQV